MSSYPNARPLIPSWSPSPIPNLSLSAGGLLALADLNTVAQRTVIAGGSSWLDALVLAPGLHYQQAADALDHKLDGAAAIAAAAVESLSDVTAAADAAADPVRYVVSNAALVGFLRRFWPDAADAAAGTVILDVAMPRDAAALGRQDLDDLVQRVSGFVHRRPRAAADARPGPPVEVDWLSHVFYLLSPLLTTAAVTLMVLLGDWWGLAFILALMLSRILNIWSIKQRSRPDPKRAPPAPDDDRLTEFAIDLGNGRRAVLRGLSSDLQAVTTQTWLRAKSNLDGYLEAAAKLLVYLVAAFSGNLSQAGAIVLMALLLISAGLLGLSNAHARGLQMNGRVARLRGQQQPKHAVAQCQGLERMPTDGESRSLGAHAGREGLLRLS